MTLPRWCSRSGLRDPNTPWGSFFHWLCFVFIVVGVVANVIVVVVMSRPNLRKTSTAVLLISLAFFDILKLLTALEMWTEDFFLDVKTQGKTYLTSTPSCAAFMFVQKAATMTAIWMVTTVTLERLVVVFMPLQAKTRLTRSFARVVVAIVFLVNVVVNCDYIFTIRYDAKRRDCSSRTYYPEYCEYHSKFKGIAECLWKLLPLAINLVVNSLIIIKVRFHTPKRMRQDRPSSMTRHNDSAKGHSNQLLKMLLTVSIVSTLILIPPNVSSAVSKFTSQSKCNSEKIIQLAILPKNVSTTTTTTTIISVNSTPSSFFVDNSNYSSDVTVLHDDDDSFSADCAWSMFKVFIAGRPFFILNHSINFFLYIISGALFRREFVTALRSFTDRVGGRRRDEGRGAGERDRGCWGGGRCCWSGEESEGGERRKSSLMSLLTERTILRSKSRSSSDKGGAKALEAVAEAEAEAEELNAGRSDLASDVKGEAEAKNL